MQMPIYEVTFDAYDSRNPNVGSEVFRYLVDTVNDDEDQVIKNCPRDHWDGTVYRPEWMIKDIRRVPAPENGLGVHSMLCVSHPHVHYGAYAYVWHDRNEVTWAMSTHPAARCWQPTQAQITRVEAEFIHLAAIGLGSWVPTPQQRAELGI
jgi:hypothetical protein